MSNALPLDAFSEERKWERFPKHESMSPMRQHGWSCRAELRPSGAVDWKYLSRALLACAGLKWDAVRSNLLRKCQGWYERDRFLDLVETKVVMIDGLPHDPQMRQTGGRKRVWTLDGYVDTFHPVTWEYSRIWANFYVDPATGILCHNPKEVRPKAAPPPVDCIPLNGNSALYLESGIWFLLKWRERTSVQTWYTCKVHGSSCGRKALDRWDCYNCPRTKTAKIEKISNFDRLMPKLNRVPNRLKKVGSSDYYGVTTPNGVVTPPGESMWIYKKTQVSTRDLARYLEPAKEVAPASVQMPAMLPLYTPSDVNLPRRKYPVMSKSSLKLEAASVDHQLSRMGVY